HPAWTSKPSFSTKWPSLTVLMRRLLVGRLANISTFPLTLYVGMSIVPVMTIVFSLAQASLPPLAFAHLSEISCVVGSLASTGAVSVALGTGGAWPGVPAAKYKSREAIAK